MRIFSKIKIKTRLIITLLITVVIFGAFAIFATYGLNKIIASVRTIYNHPFEVSNATLRVKVGILEMKEIIDNIIVSTDVNMTNIDIAELSNKEKEIYLEFDKIQQLILGEEGQKLAKDTRTVFENWKKVRDKTINIKLSENIAAANEFDVTTGHEYIDKMEKMSNEVYNYARNKADVLMNTSIEDETNYRNLQIYFSIAILSLLILSFIYIIQNLSKTFKIFQEAMAKSVSTGQVRQITLSDDTEFKELAVYYNQVVMKLDKKIWIKDGINKLGELLFEHKVMDELALNIVSFLARYLGAGNALFYLYNENEKSLELTGSFASNVDELKENFKVGCGIVGQVALEKRPILLDNSKKDEANISKNVLDEKSVSKIITGSPIDAPFYIYAFPILHEDEILAVIELTSFQEFNQAKQDFLIEVANVLSSVLVTVIQSEKIAKLFIEATDARRLAEEMAQEAEMRSLEVQNVNAQLEEQQQTLQQQSEELQNTNCQMEEQQQILLQQSSDLKKMNTELTLAQEELEIKAEKIEHASNYKSQFIANMSHELRTPLNSVIMLSRVLMRNKSQNLSNHDIEKIQIIYNSGNELLRHIAGILDVSKISAGKMELMVSKFNTEDLINKCVDMFSIIASEKNIEFIVRDELKTNIENDFERISQILLNFLSNSFKFTEKGSVSLIISKSELPEKPIRIQVVDTGIGISKDTRGKIFEAFEQLDATITRRYGGTGLGLYICKNLADILGADISFDSVEGEGSVFSLLLCEKFVSAKLPEEDNLPADIHYINNSTGVNDDRNNISKTDKVILFVEDIVSVCDSVSKIIHEFGYKTIISTNATDIGVSMASNIDGIIVGFHNNIEKRLKVIDAIKNNIALNGIPINIFSDYDSVENVIEDMFAGADNFYKKIMIVESDEEKYLYLKDIVKEENIRVYVACDEKVFRKNIEKYKYDLLIIDAGLGGSFGMDICKYIAEEKIDIPIILYSWEEISPQVEKEAKKFTNSIIIHSQYSDERLKKETQIFLNTKKVIKSNELISNSNSGQMQKINLKNKRVLIVDDDPKNIYVLTSALEEYGVVTFDAENGEIALEILEEKSCDLILMDIMMPVLNGFECIERIRKNSKTKDIPIIAITAKSLKDDKEKCIEAGANDYISKPVDYDVFIKLVNAWINKN